MKKIKGIYLGDDERLILVTEDGDQYRIDWDDYIDPRWHEISRTNIHYDWDVDDLAKNKKGNKA